MKIVRIGGTSLDNILAVVVSEDEAGMPEGAAHWNGHAWRWLARKANAWTIDVQASATSFYLLDFNGAVETWTAARCIATTHVPHVGCNGLCVSNASTLFVAGLRGGLFSISSTGIVQVSLPVTSNLYSITLQKRHPVACGADGVVIQWDGEVARLLLANQGFGLTHIASGVDDFTLATGSASGRGVLVEVAPSPTIHTLANALQWICVVSRTEVFGVDLSGKTYSVTDAKPTPHSVSRALQASYITRIGSDVIVAGIDAMAVVNGSQFDLIPLSLDASFLEAS
jgi:hypothetical protein